MDNLHAKYYRRNVGIMAFVDLFFLLAFLPLIFVDAEEALALVILILALPALAMIAITAYYVYQAIYYKDKFHLITF